MKRIVICADGTWNVRDQINDETGKPRPTNVTKVARAVLPRDANGIDQVVFYHDGIGTRGGLDKVTGGAFGHGMEAAIRVLYRFIVYNYVHGDEIYIFGFSRGAFTARSLVGFMNKVGLLQKDDDYYVPEIYGCYEKGLKREGPEWKHAFRNIRDTQPAPPVHFVGVWDTVGALGAPGVLGRFHKGKYKYHDVGLNPNVRHAYHALAIDERRKPFAPTLWTRPAGWQGSLEQAWFCGVHSNIGGGYYPDGLANEALHWMVEKAEGLGLAVDNDYLAHFLPCFNSRLHDSMSMFYKLMGEHVRKLGDHVTHGEMIHESVLDRLKHGPSAYAASNVTAAQAALSAAVARTGRVARGTPCPDL